MGVSAVMTTKNTQKGKQRKVTPWKQMQKKYFKESVVNNVK
jgi:CMP-2-keto-3-deoxyoctulosonic acid synthetase